MSTKYTKKHKIPYKTLCINCKTTIKSGKKCSVCDNKSGDNNIYWSGEKYVKNGPTCVGYFKNTCGNIVHNPKRTQCLECFFNEIEDT